MLLIKKARLEAEYLGKQNFEISNEIKDKYIQIYDNEYALFLKRKALLDEEVLKSRNNIQMSSSKYDAAMVTFDAASEEYSVVTKLFEKGLESKLSKIKSGRAFPESLASKGYCPTGIKKGRVRIKLSNAG